MRVALAYSGGLDTTVCIKLLQEKWNAEVITVCVDVGQSPEDLQQAAERAEKLGVLKHVYIDARNEFIEKYVFQSVKANGNYEGYPLSTALARYPIAAKVVEVAKKEDADALAHGCTGKGNDQFRFDITFSLLAPELKIIAPIRELNLDRQKEIEYAIKNKIPVPVKKNKPYSVDENLWGRSIEGGVLENPAEPPPEEIYTMTVSPEKVKKKSKIVSVNFEKGVPVGLNNKRIGGVELVNTLNKLAGSYGIGRIELIEDRILGLKARENYEAPAATVILQAHKALEQFVLTKQELFFKQIVDQLWSDLVYSGFWFDPFKQDLDAFIDKTQERVTGKVKVELSPGSSRVVGRESPYSLYEEELVSFEKFGFDQREVASVIKFFSLQSVIAGRRRKIAPQR